MLRLAPALTLLLVAGPILVGLAGTLLPAFGHMPAIGLTGPSLDPWRRLLATPGLSHTLQATLVAGFVATLASFLLAAGFCALAAGSRAVRAAGRLLAPLLATPHAAVALGFAFLVAPSGWIARLISPELTGWTRPPTGLPTVGDPYGLALAAGLVLKETPYLILMMLGASTLLPVQGLLATSRALGQRGPAAWLKGVLPQIYPQIRLPLYAVLAFSLSVVDVAIILGPSQPPTLSVLAARWFADYDLSLYPAAAAAAVLQLGLCGGAIALWRLAEIPAAALGRLWIERGSRGLASAGLAQVSGLLAVLAGGLAGLSLLGMAVWSVAQAWRFPDAWPSALGLETWAAQGPSVGAAAATTLAVGVAATALAVLLALACLEGEQRRGRRSGRAALGLLYLPLLVPQIAFLFGVQVALVRLSLEGTWLAVTWSHLVFVLPYVFLSLADPYRALDPRLAATAAALGAGPLRVMLAVKLPVLLRPLLVAAAVGFAVSVAQYLATAFPGGGRVATLTTEAVTLSGGADRRVIGVYAVLQAALPLLAYAAALAIPALLHRDRRALRA